MDGIKELGKRRGLFENEIEFNDRYASIVRFLRDEVKIFNSALYDFEKLKYNTDRVLSSEEIFIEKKNKKGLIKKTDIKNAIKSYRFAENSLFIVLKTGQNLEGGIPSLRADTLMELIAPDVKFDITRTRFFDENDKEL